MWKDFACYIIKNYADTNKIIEVGVGKFHEVAHILQEHLKMDIIMTDIKPSHSRVIKDDLTCPNLKIYTGASLIYSIRPPLELHPYLLKVAEKVGADLIIKPLSTEYIESINTKNKMKLINYKKAIFFKMCTR
ncbi:MAG: hypothetical protein FJ150_04195 [Euryarchaeota archaeon]|nr:hypothetical protein [Euryarchaeota archaeon]